MKCKLMIIVIVVLISMSSCQNQPKEGFNEFTVNGEKRYKYVENGNIITGWIQIDGEWYYFDKETQYSALKWLKIDDKYYYFDYNGKMLHDEWTKDGYFLDSNGVYIPGTGNGYASAVTAEEGGYNNQLINVDYGSSFYFNFFRMDKSKELNIVINKMGGDGSIVNENFIWEKNHNILFVEYKNFKVSGNLAIKIFNTSNELLAENIIVVGINPNAKLRQNNQSDNRNLMKNLQLRTGYFGMCKNFHNQLTEYINVSIQSSKEEINMRQNMLKSYFELALDEIQTVEFQNQYIQDYDISHDISECKSMLRDARTIFGFLR